MSQFDDVSVVKKANVYFDGRCISHTVLFKDGSRKSVGVILPGAPLTFNTGAPEVMELTGGRCRVRLPGAADWQAFGAGQSFKVAGNSRFDIEALEPLDYVCHFG